MGSRDHLTDTDLLCFVEGRDASVAAAVGEHVERCLACKIRAMRLSGAVISAPGDAVVSQLAAASPVIPQHVADVLQTAPDPEAHPASGEIWRIGRSEAMLVWVRRVIDDSALVLPVTLDLDLADEYSLIVPAADSPVGTDIVVVASVEGQADLRTFLQLLGALPAEAQIGQLRLARREGKLPDADIPTGPPIESASDQRLEYRQLLADLLADLSPEGLAQECPATAEELDDGIDLHQLSERLGDLTWRRAGCTVRHADIASVQVDAAHELLVAAVVGDLGKNVLVTVLTGVAPSITLSSPGVAAACGALLRRYPDADDIAVTIADSDWTAVIIDPPYSLPAVEVPSGAAVGPRVTSQPLPVIDALTKYFEQTSTRWQETERVQLDGAVTDLGQLAMDATRSAVERVVAEGHRAHIPTKKAAYTALSHDGVRQITKMIDAIVSGRSSTTKAIDELLNGGEA
jgi:hypothetical protein